MTSRMIYLFFSLSLFQAIPLEGMTFQAHKVPNTLQADAWMLSSV